MTYRIKGTLKLPDGAPAANCEIEFVSRKNFSPLVQGAKTNILTSATGDYDVTLELGEYAVILYTGGTYPAQVGTILLSADTVAGQDLPSLLQHDGWTPATPEYVQQIENWVASASQSATNAEASADAAADSAEQAALNGSAVVSREALRRSYAEAGLSLVDGSFEEGGTLTSTSDVLLHKASGIAYSGPIGQVAAGTNPTVTPGFVSRAGALLRGALFKQSVMSELCGGSIYEAVSAAKIKNEIVYLSSGNYSGSPIDGSGTAGIIGNGINSTVIKAPVSFVNPSDVYGYGAAFVAKNLTVEVNTDQPALSVAFSHYYSGENISIINSKPDGTALSMANAWLGNFKNAYFQGGAYGAFLKGSCHAVKFERCRFYSGAAGDAFHIENTTPSSDGNLSVMLDTCDIEFCDGNGINNAGAQKLIVLNPYHESVGGFNIINTGNASTTVDGGSIAVGKQLSVVKIDSGQVIVRNCRLYSESATSSLQKLVSSTGGSVGFFDIELALPALGSLVVHGELMRGPSKQSLCRRSVNMWTPDNMQQEYVAQGVNKYTMVASGPSFCELRCFNDRDNYIFPADQLFNVYITYSSNVDFSLRTQASAGGGAPTSPYTVLPSTAGETVTLVVPGVSGLAFSNSVQTSIYRDAAVSGDYIVLHDIGIFSNKSHPIDRQIWFPS